MATRIDKPIVGFDVVKPEGETKARKPRSERADVIHMHEKVERPDGLDGATYKIKTPLDEHALYVTINDIILNQGTPHEQRRPFEIFINSKNMDHFQWIVALTRVMSSVFRKGGDVTFLSEELQAVFDPRGGYFKPGGKFMPSLVAEIGAVVEQHLRRIGLICDEAPDPTQQAMIAQKRAEADAGTVMDSQYPASATLCNKCNTKALVLSEGCETCLSCGHSKCG